jgi:hypothetical protein
VTVVSGAPVGATDLYIAHLSAPLPSSIKYYKVLPSNFASYAPGGNLINWPMVNSCTIGNGGAQQHQALVQDVTSSSASSNTEFGYLESSETNRIPYTFQTYSGTSGSPCFAIILGEPIVLGCLHTTVQITSISLNFAAVNQVLSNAPTATPAGVGSSYQLTPVDLSSFHTY